MSTDATADARTRARASDETVGASLAASSPLGPGERVGRYRVVDRLGSGAFGVVYAAHDPELDRRVAIKLLGARAGVSQASLLREGQAMAQLAHPNVVTVHDVGVHDGAVFVAMELVDGENLREWLAGGRRSLHEIVAVFLAAGSGLAAAHAVGLIHRDFKPDNVLVGRDRRVCVGDFGVATTDPSATSDGSRSGVRFEPSHETRTGYVMGTPAYMAPEQQQGASIDARADQFAFCVAMWEAVHACRPFDARTHELRLRAIVRGAVVPAESPGVPARLRRALLRGLQAEPGARHPDMAALLDALARSIRPRTGRWLAAGAVAATSLGALLLAATDREAPCDGGATEMTGLWDDATRAAVTERLGAGGSAFARDTAAAIDARLSAWAGAWATIRDDTCVAARTQGGAGDVDAITACLGRAKAAFVATVDALEHADETLVANAHDLTDAMPDPSACMDPGGSEARSMPSDDATRAEVGRLREALAEAWVLQGAGRFAEADARTAESVARARALGFEPLLAEALLQHGRIAVHSTGGGTAAPMLEDAALLATAHGLDALALSAWDALATLDGGPGTRVGDDAAAHLRHGDAILARIAASDVATRAAHEHARGRALERMQRFQDAVAAYHEAEQLTIAAHGEEDRRVAVNATALARVLQEVGDFDAAEQQARKAFEILRVRLGDHHPSLGDVLTQIGTIEHRRGRLAQSREAFARALAIREAAYPDDHDRVADAISNLAVVDMMLGDFESARANLERVEALERRRGDPIALAMTVHNLGAVALERGDLVEAERRTREGLALLEGALDGDDPRLGNSLETLGSLLLERQAYDEAEAILERALRLWTVTGRSDHPGHAGALAELGRLQRLQGRDAEAEVTLRRALEILARHDVDPIMVVHTMHDHVQALWALGRETDARAEAAQTRARAAELTGSEADRIRPVLEAWAAAHGGVGTSSASRQRP